MSNQIKIDARIFVNDDGFSDLPTAYAQGDSITLDSHNDFDFPNTRIDDFALVEITFTSSHDGRGFSIACALRDQGYSGLILATGAIIPDQYRHLRQCGFDGVLLSKAQAKRMPEPHWSEQVAKIVYSYQNQIFE